MIKQLDMVWNCRPNNLQDKLQVKSWGWAVPSSAKLKLATTSSKLATNKLGASYPLATYQLAASWSSVGPQNYYSGCRVSYGVGWFPTVVIKRLCQPPAGDWLAGLGWAWEKYVTIFVKCPWPTAHFLFFFATNPFKSTFTLVGEIIHIALYTSNS